MRTYGHTHTHTHADTKIALCVMKAVQEQTKKSSPNFKGIEANQTQDLYQYIQYPELLRTLSGDHRRCRTFIYLLSASSFSLKCQRVK